MAFKPDQAARLAPRLKELRERSWPQVTLTQAQLATAFSGEDPVTHATISGWESPANPKSPTTARIDAYARFFATQRSLEEPPHVLAAEELTPDERARYTALKDELLGLVNPPSTVSLSTVAPGSTALGHTFAFDDGPITVICPEAPGEQRGPLADEKDPNFTRLQQYGDLDALIELYGHLRASNPTLDVYHRLASSVASDDMSSHVILLGGIAWNRVTKRFQEATRQVPITQILNDPYPGGDPFEVVTDGIAERVVPEWETDEDGERWLTEDVAFVARLRNPFNARRTLTICNGVHSRGVFGAVRCLTDSRVRDANEQYLAERFPDGRFAVLMRVPVVANKTMSPDLQNPSARLVEWPSANGGSR